MLSIGCEGFRQAVGAFDEVSGMRSWFFLCIHQALVCVGSYSGIGRHDD